MARFTATFADDTAGAAPAGWTSRWDSGTPTVVSDATGLGGKIIRLPSTAGRRFFSFDAAGTPGDFEILTRCRLGSTDTGRLWMAGRGSGTTSTANCVQGGIYNGATSTILARYVNGGGGLVSGASAYNPNLSAGVWFRQRMRITGDQAWFKIWADGSAEPSSWSIGPLTDAVIPAAAGWVGLMSDAAGASTRDVDWISVGTNGDSALEPSVAEPEPEPEPTATGIYVGAGQASRIYVGSAQASRIYVGSTLVWG